MENIPPVVFISYSHDSPEHKRWVYKFAANLMDKGIDVILDQWDLRPGDDVPKFMEKSVDRAQRVLMICTEKYVKKANEGEGGVGYESMIVTGELVKNLGTSKFIPIVRQTNEEIELPKSVSTRYYINISSTDRYNENIEELLRELHKKPAIRKPLIGKNPFTLSPSKKETPKAEPTANILSGKVKIVNNSANVVYQEAFDIARAGDLNKWRKLILNQRRFINEALIQWRDKYENEPISSLDAALPIAIEGIETYAPLIAVAIAGIESGRHEFKNQISLLDDILYPRNWAFSGKQIVSDLPIAIAYIYQGIHGAICLETGQIETALLLIKTPTDFPNISETIPLWKHHGVMGWPDGFEGKATTAWDELKSLPKKWDWLNLVFIDIEEYEAALSAYYMALNFYEYCDYVKNRDKNQEKSGETELEIPICFNVATDDVIRRAFRLLTNDTEKVRSICEWFNLDKNLVTKYWDEWMETCKKWVINVYRSHFFNVSIAHEKLPVEIFK